MGNILLTDEEINLLLSEKKELLSRNLFRPRLRDTGWHKRCTMKARGVTGARFQIRLRQGLCKPQDFSVIFAYFLPTTRELFHLRRYDGWDRHGGKRHDCVLCGFHIHRATERSQALGIQTEYQAEVTNRYFDILSAYDCMLQDCGFEFVQPQKRLL